MALRADLQSLVHFEVTPRFEIFYALRALGESSDRTAQWRQRTKALLPKGFKGIVRKVAPRPMMWALLADVLRDARSDATFAEILDAIESLDDVAFQRAILGGVFRREGTVDALVTGEQSLADATAAEGESGNALVALLGLHPSNQSSSVPTAFNRIISEPAGYRADLARVLIQFWNHAFSENWLTLEPRMHRIAESMRTVLRNRSVAAFAKEIKLPVAFDDRRKVVASLRGAATFPYEMLSEIHVIPSAFNDTRIWGAYRDDPGSVRLYFPVFEATLLQAQSGSSDPELAFRALGDTTRYAMAFFLAETPRTSVELAKAFGVSKPTISHHVQLLRAACLLNEKATEKGVELTLNREALEGISIAAATEMFSGGKSPVIRRSRHEGKSHQQPGEKKQSRKPPRGADE
jgi:ArsR family transcriptional regulator